MAENAHTFGADLSKGLIVGGTSAGANIAATVVHKAQNDPFFEGRRVTGQILQIPTLIHPHGYPDKSVTLSLLIDAYLTCSPLKPDIAKSCNQST